MNLYSREGDQGYTSLFDGQRVRKDHPRIEACGAMDELNSILGWATVACTDTIIRQRIEAIQDHLFRIGADLSIADPNSSIRSQTPVVTEEHITQIEQWIDQAVATIPPLKAFILPGGTETASRLHIARTACRRAERRVVELMIAQQAPEKVFVYLNRLGDLLFAWARQTNWQNGIDDIVWKPSRPSSENNTGKNPCE